MTERSAVNKPDQREDFNKQAEKGTDITFISQSTFACITLDRENIQNFSKNQVGLFDQLS